MANILNIFSLVFILIFVGLLRLQDGKQIDEELNIFEQYEIKNYQKLLTMTEDNITLNNTFRMFTRLHNSSVLQENFNNKKINSMDLYIEKSIEKFHMDDALFANYKLKLDFLIKKKHLLENLLASEKQLNDTLSNINKLNYTIHIEESKYIKNKKHDDALALEIRKNDEEARKLRLGQENKSESYESEIGEVKTQLKSCTSCCKADSCIAFGNSTDIHVIHVNERTGAFNVSCNGQLDGAGPGWTVIQRRIDGSENFYRNWNDYKMGFGNLSGEFFIGMEKLHQMTTKERCELYIHLEDFNNEIRFARYDDFQVDSEDNAYKLISLGEYSGNAEDALEDDVGYTFSTFDQGDSMEIANARHSAWWFDESNSLSNLNGRYLLQNETILDYQGTGIFWYSSDWHDMNYSFKSVQMMIRPKDNNENTEKETL